MRTGTLTLFRRLLLVTVALLPSTLVAESGPDKVRIGIIAAFSGPLAEVGESMRNSAELAKRAFDPNNRIEFLIEDDQFNPAKTVAAAKKMIEVDKAQALVVFGSNTALGMADVAEKAHIPTFAISLSERVVDGRSYIFRYFSSAGAVAEALSQEMLRRKYPSMALITTQQDGMVAMREEFLKHPHPEIVYSAEILPSDSDLRTVATKISSANPSVVLMMTFGFQAANIAKNLKISKFPGELCSGPPLQIESAVKGAEGGLEGAWIATADDHASKDYYAAYKAAFNAKPLPDATFSYDAIRLLIEGAYEGDIQRHLNKTKHFQGIYGEAIQNSKNSYDLKTSIKVIRNGEFFHLDAR